MVQKIGLSVLDYARFHGLAYDHLERHPLSDLDYPEDLLASLEDPPDGVQIDGFNTALPEERLTMTVDEAKWLSSITNPSYEYLEFDGDDTLDVHRIRNLKQELPLLRTDHECDMQEFRRQIVPDLLTEHLPLESVDEEQDEGLDWPSKCYELPGEFARSSESEKLEASKDTILYLQRVLKIHQEGGENKRFQHDFAEYKTNTALDPVTPPLLPLTPPSYPFEPSSDAGHLDLLSDVTSPTQQEARDLEKILFKDDAIVPKEEGGEPKLRGSDPMLLDFEDLGEIYSPLKGGLDLPSSPPTARGRLEDRKVEGPLTPPISDLPQPWKIKDISFREALLQVIPEIPPPIPRPEGASSPDINTFFAENIAPIAVKAERSIEQEQLQEADTTRRVTVPCMDFSLPVPPWKVPGDGFDSGASINTYKTFLSKVKSDHLSKHVWPMIGKTERGLPWAPFPAELRRTAISEEIQDDGAVEPFVMQPECIDSSLLTWKPEGLRILDESDDESLENGMFPEANDLDFLIKKRKLELEELSDQDQESAIIDSGIFSTRLMAHEKAHGRIPKRILAANSQLHQDKPIRNSEIAKEGNFPASDALGNFMSIRSGETQKWKPQQSQIIPSKQNPLIAEPQEKVLDPKAGKEARQQSSIAQAFPIPQMSIPTTPRHFVVSTTLLRHRKLCRRIQQLFPSADFIERDFNLYTHPARPPPSSRTNNPPPLPSHLADTMADEADVILSPSTGLIYTTLQEIKQQSLPGQAARSPIRDRITRTAPRYERLLVLISEGSSLTGPTQTMGELNTNDCTALIELMGFCANLDEDIQVLFVGGGEEQLAQWIVGMMAEHSVADSGLRLLQEETLWELFLRRAGMNAFAAQAVLAELEAPEPKRERISPSIVDFEFGLAAFVRMGAEERARRFEGLVGGRRLLRRVSGTLDARW